MEIYKTSLDNHYMVKCDTCKGEYAYSYDQLTESYDSREKIIRVDCNCSGGNYINIEIDTSPYMHVTGTDGNESKVNVYCINKLSSNGKSEYYLYAFINIDD